MRLKKRSKIYDPLADAVDGLRPEHFKPTKRKDSVLTIRLTSEIKQGMRETAESLGISISDYLARLHFIAVKKLNEKRKSLIGKGQKQ